MSAGNKINLLPGDYVFREGEFGQTAYIIETGTMELVKYTGDEHTVLTELEKGALFGEMAIIDNSARSACLLYTSPSPRDTERSRMPSSA